ncbi:hypothetical protein YPHTV1_00024 [Halomonas phage YPHTV-1]|nr:hypothetical protein YPHTV1_00024 [Halomonas phage YPHTV-1]
MEAEIMISKTVELKHPYKVTKYKFLGILIYKKYEHRGAR